MAIEQPPAFLQAGSYTARQDRLNLISNRFNPTTLNTSDMAARGGILPGQAARQATFSMTNWDVTINKFVGIVENTFAATSGDYEVYSTNAQVLTVTASSPTTNRIDIIGVRVQDAFYSGALNQADLVIVQGTPSAGAPSDPVLPSSFLPIVRVTVSAATSTGTLTDLRKRTSIAGATYSPFTLQLTDNGTAAGETQLMPAAGVYPARLRVWDGAAWKGVSTFAFDKPTQTGSGALASAATLVVMSVSVADPGYAYKLSVSGSADWAVVAAAAPDNLISASITLDSTTYNVGEIERGYQTSASIGAGFTQAIVVVSPTTSATLTGAHTIRLIVRNFSATGFTIPAASVATTLSVLLVPA
jgi:hypothetical protein